MTYGVGSKNQFLSEQIQKFCRLEEKESPTNRLTRTERRYEAFFSQPATRNKDGPFIVRLRFASKASDLGETEDIAHQTLLAFERKFHRKPGIEDQYLQLMYELIRLRHGEEVDLSRIKKPPYFLLYHCIFKLAWF